MLGPAAATIPKTAPSDCITSEEKVPKDPRGRELLPLQCKNFWPLPSLPSLPVPNYHLISSMADREKTVEWEQGETHEKQTRGPPIQLNNLLVDNNNPADLLDTLNLGKRNAVTEYVRVTKESTDFAIQALEKYEWDLLEAIGRFFDEGSHEQDRINVDMLTPAIEPIRTSKRVNKRRFKANKPTLRHTILNRATLQNGMESPRNPRAVILDPIALEYAPPEIITTAPRMFTSPYPDKLWYTGFMRPWERFTEEVLDQWTNESCTKAFDEVRLS